MPADGLSICANHPWYRTSIDKNRYEPQDRIPRHEARQPNNSDDQVGRRDSPVPACVSHWLRAKILSGGVDNLLPCAMDDGEMRALEDRAERPGHIDEVKFHGADELTTKVDACTNSWPKGQGST